MRAYLLALAHFVLSVAIAALLNWVTGADLYGLLIGMALFQACLSGAKAEAKP